MPSSPRRCSSSQRDLFLGVLESWGLSQSTRCHLCDDLGFGSVASLAMCTDDELGEAGLPLGTRKVIQLQLQSLGLIRRRSPSSASPLSSSFHSMGLLKEDVNELMVILGMLVWGVAANYIHLRAELKQVIETQAWAQIGVLLMAAFLTFPEFSVRQFLTAALAVVLFLYTCGDVAWESTTGLITTSRFLIAACTALILWPLVQHWRVTYFQQHTKKNTNKRRRRRTVGAANEEEHDDDGRDEAEWEGKDD